MRWAALIALSLLVSAGAARAADLDLGACKPVFADEFDKLSVDRTPGKARWFPHTPWNGDFGVARFTDPFPGFPFSVKDGVLSITASARYAGVWRSGLLSSTGPDGRGFSRRYGYFEIRAKLPAGASTWPAFWLESVTPHDGPYTEIDVFEGWGSDDHHVGLTLHLWNADGHGQHLASTHWADLSPASLSGDFHTYGALVTPMEVVIYFDRKEIWRTPALSAAPTPPLGVLIDLAVVQGPARDPSVMLVDYVRVYDPPETCRGG